MEIAVKNLMFDASNGKEIFDDDRVISKAEVDEKIAQICFEYTGLTKDSSEKQIKRVLESEKCREFFEVIEEVIEKKIETGLKESEFFNAYVETINLKDGDRNDFWADKDIILNVEKVSGSNHDLCRIGSVQRKVA